MARYLLALVCDPHSTAEYLTKVFSVSDDCSPYHVTVPENTICFKFVSANVRTAQEFEESFIAIEIGDANFTNSSIPFEEEQDGKRYFIGKCGSFFGIDGVFNSKTETFVTADSLSDIDEIIDI